MTATGNSFLGTGWDWPIEVDATGSVAMVSGIEQLEQAMYLVLSTEPGERPMRPEFGCRLRQYVFAPANATTASLIAGEARSALTRWEPRVAVEDIEVSTDHDDPAVLWVDVTYTVRTTNNRRNLVFPFYVIPGAEESPTAADPRASLTLRTQSA
jgi:phage baseplate assembly protein W